jgi:hypothetical protein
MCSIPENSPRMGWDKVKSLVREWPRPSGQPGEQCKEQPAVDKLPLPPLQLREPGGWRLACAQSAREEPQRRWSR